MRTPERLHQRRVQRATRRHFAEHPPTPKTVDPLKRGVEFLASLRCDDSTTRQERLPR